MDKDATHKLGRRRALAATALLLGACGTGGDIDPRMLAVRSEMPPPQPAPLLVPATGHVHVATARPPAAPAAETGAQLERVERPTLDTERVVLGHNAAASVDPRLQRAFAASRDDVRTEFVVCTDREVVELLMVGRAEFGLIGGDLSTREVQAGLRQTQIGVELFALTVSPDSSVRSLTNSQVRDIFTGKVTDWQQLGMGSGAIVPVVPSDPDVAERASRALMPGDAFASTCVKARNERYVVDQLLQHKGAIGIVRINEQPRETGQRLIQIDWTSPTREAYGYGTYPYGVPLHLVTSGQPDASARAFLEFARSEQGQQMLGQSLVLTR